MFHISCGYDTHITAVSPQIEIRKISIQQKNECFHSIVYFKTILPMSGDPSTAEQRDSITIGAIWRRSDIGLVKSLDSPFLQVLMTFFFKKKFHVCKMEFSLDTKKIHAFNKNYRCDIRFKLYIGVVIIILTLKVVHGLECSHSRSICPS